MPLTISEVTARRVPPAVAAVIAYLEKLPPDQVVEATEICEAMGRVQTFMRDIRHYLPNHTAKARGRNYYGSRRTIAKLRTDLRKQLGAK